MGVGDAARTDGEAIRVPEGAVQEHVVVVVEVLRQAQAEAEPVACLNVRVAECAVSAN